MDPLNQPLADFMAEYRLPLQKVWVIDLFRRLWDIDKWEVEAGSQVFGGLGSPSNFFDYPGASRENVKIQLHSWILPLFSQQLNALLPLLDPAEFQKDPGTKLALILQLQAGIAHSMIRVQSALALICPRPLYFIDQTNDRHGGQFKTYRLHMILDATENIISDPCEFFYWAGERIRQMGLSTQQSTHEDDSHSECELTHVDAIDLIEWTIEYLKTESEMEFIQRFSGTVWIDGLLRSALLMLDPKAHFQLAEHEQYYTVEIVREPVIELLKLLVPIAKLSRMFFGTLKKIVSRKHLSSYSEMNSAQLGSVCHSCQVTGHGLNSLLELLSEANVAISPDETYRICEDIIDISTHSKPGGLLMILLHLIPMIPETDGLPDQNYYQSWFCRWHILMILAIDNFQTSARRFQETVS
ncbi:hypothetical protein PTTG_29492 [Puccinia triticina 1-1 BBBD Race 1]|uniref:Uncharacterized protein n=2 Tax=Puccinia triticina TaxID=208348 RepID=A0A180G3R4_PUCT1|nr:uncharacterized protein PtA15_1A519 [Puccinia triticina]OAV87291.1 hypothetical protein PTTG_29492 [Puccinia triticina 1-1 BBBD Race 1]WAQ81180.1 hypothetical protein PtA15_1A519 [Puccinia triticina]